MARYTTQASAMNSYRGMPRSCGLNGDNGVVNNRWKPSECPVCFDEIIVVWKTGTGFDCKCMECGHLWKETFAAHWKNR